MTAANPAGHLGAVSGLLGLRAAAAASFWLGCILCHSPGNPSKLVIYLFWHFAALSLTACCLPLRLSLSSPHPPSIFLQIFLVSHLLFSFILPSLALSLRFSFLLPLFSCLPRAPPSFLLLLSLFLTSLFIIIPFFTAFFPLLSLISPLISLSLSPDCPGLFTFLSFAFGDKTLGYGFGYEVVLMSSLKMFHLSFQSCRKTCISREEAVIINFP